MANAQLTRDLRFLDIPTPNRRPYKYWVPPDIPYELRPAWFEGKPDTWKRYQSMSTIRGAFEDTTAYPLRDPVFDWIECMTRKAQDFKPPIRVPVDYEGPLALFVAGDLPQDDLARMARLADICIDAVKEAHEAHVAKINELHDEAGMRDENPNPRAFPSLDDLQRDVKSRADKAFREGGFNALMAGIGKILRTKHPATGTIFAPFKPAGMGAMPARLLPP
ncbi:MAG: hypothetical protein M1816_005034 [Peltula sp. TS41687]|nr:MAG: hypothetical protein M1816_005034 [Peltula sp. TS41687]